MSAARRKADGVETVVETVRGGRHLRRQQEAPNELATTLDSNFASRSAGRLWRRSAGRIERYGTASIRQDAADPAFGE